MSADGGSGGRRSWRRAFGWGVLFIGDATADVVVVDPDVPFTWGTVDEAFCVVVRHGQDVDDDVLEGLAPDDEVPWAEVSLEVRLGETAPDDVDGDGVVAVPTGVLTIGDADEEERFDVEPGLWRVQIALSPLQDAETVKIWISRAR